MNARRADDAAAGSAASRTAGQPTGFDPMDRPVRAGVLSVVCPACGESGALLEQVGLGVWYCQVCSWSSGRRPV